jgi:S-adenosylmethionine/arginine decarboxylase-like enzyme
MRPITKSQLIKIAKDLDSHDWRGFANAVSALDPTLGATVALHAAAADGNSPDVAEWVEHTLADAVEVEGMTVAEAREWWHDKYGHAGAPHVD